MYLILSSGISQAFRILPWWIFIQLGLDALFFIFWIAAAGTSHLSCHDLCSACDAWGGDAWFDSLYCTCYSAYDDIFIKKRDTSPNPSLGLSGGLQKRRSRYSSAGRATGTLVAREAFDGLLVYVFHPIFPRRLFLFFRVLLASPSLLGTLPSELLLGRYDSNLRSTVNHKPS